MQAGEAAEARQAVPTAPAQLQQDSELPASKQPADDSAPLGCQEPQVLQPPLASQGKRPSRSASQQAAASLQPASAQQQQPLVPVAQQQQGRHRRQASGTSAAPEPARRQAQQRQLSAPQASSRQLALGSVQQQRPSAGLQQQHQQQEQQGKQSLSKLQLSRTRQQAAGCELDRTSAGIAHEDPAPCRVQVRLCAPDFILRRLEAHASQSHALSWT